MYDLKSRFDMSLFVIKFTKKSRSQILYFVFFSSKNRFNSSFGFQNIPSVVFYSTEYLMLTKYIPTVS